MGTLNYALVQMALSMSEEAWKDGPLHDEIHVVQHFCERIVGMIDSLETITGNRIANDNGCYGKLPTYGQAVPASLQQLVRKMEAYDDPSVATNLARFANALIDAAFRGTMCERQLGRKIPLRAAIQLSAGVLITAMHAYVEKFSIVFNNKEVFEGNFDPITFRNKAHETLEVCSCLSTQCFAEPFFASIFLL